MQEEWGHELAAETLPAEEGVAIEGEVLEAVPIYAEEGMKEMISQEEVVASVIRLLKLSRLMRKLSKLKQKSCTVDVL